VPIHFEVSYQIFEISIPYFLVKHFTLQVKQKVKQMGVICRFFQKSQKQESLLYQ